MNYLCRIADNRGKTHRVIVPFSSLETMNTYWESRNCFLLSSRPVKKRYSFKKEKQALLDMTRTLALMLESGLTLKESFDIGSTLFTGGATALLIQGIQEELRKGISFSMTLTKRGDLFPPLYRGMIGVGETLGCLDQILPSLSLWLEKEKELRDKVRGALLYPALVVILVFSGVAALLFFFLPYMEETLLSTNASMGENLKRSYNSARICLILFVASGLILPITGKVLPSLKKRVPSFALYWDKCKLKIPFLKDFHLAREILSLSFAISLMTKCGIPLEKALEYGASVLGNSYLQKSLIRIRKKLIKGIKLSSLFHEETCFPSELADWTALGEKTGHTDRVFDQLKSYYQSEVNRNINLIQTLAEPAIILLLGLILGIVIINILLPLLTLYGEVL